MKIQNAVFIETRRIAYGTAVCFAITNIVALAIGEWDYTILLGALLGGVCAVACFFMLALAVQDIASLTGDEAQKLKQGKRKLRGSYMTRLVVMALVFILAARAKPFNWVATAVMLIAPRITIMAAQAYKSLTKPKSAGVSDAPAQAHSADDNNDDVTEEVND